MTVAFVTSTVSHGICDNPKDYCKSLLKYHFECYFICFLSHKLQFYWKYNNCLKSNGITACGIFRRVRNHGLTCPPLPSNPSADGFWKLLKSGNAGS